MYRRESDIIEALLHALKVDRDHSWCATRDQSERHVLGSALKRKLDDLDRTGHDVVYVDRGVGLADRTPCHSPASPVAPNYVLDSPPPAHDSGIYHHHTVHHHHIGRWVDS